MQFQNTKGKSKKKEQKMEDIRKKRKEVFDQIKDLKPEKYQFEHLHGQPNYSANKPKSILKVKTAAEQFKEDNRSDDVLLSKNAMKEILNELNYLRKKVDTIEKLEESKISGVRNTSDRDKNSGRREKTSPRRDTNRSQESSNQQSYGPEFERSLEESKDSRKSSK